MAWKEMELEDVGWLVDGAAARHKHYDSYPAVYISLVSVVKPETISFTVESSCVVCKRKPIIHRGKIPIDCNGIVVGCNQCKTNLLRVTGFVSRKWKMEVWEI